jgi:hypothetical protein
MYQQGLSHGQADRANNLAHQYRLQPNNADDAVPMSLDTTRVIKTIVIPTAMAMGRMANMDTMTNWAARNGFQDGANDGLQDRQAGKSSRATKHNA